MQKLYAFCWEFRRMGTVESLFIEDSDLVDDVIGKEVYLGEVLGKHSDIYGTLNESDLTVISEDPEFIDKFYQAFRTANLYLPGPNPISRYEDRISDEPELDPEFWNKWIRDEDEEEMEVE